MKTAFLSIILAVMNLLPIPGLDGGHALFTLWEIITRRKPSEKFLEVAQYVGLMIILALLVYANGNDIYRFFIKYRHERNIGTLPPESRPARIRSPDRRNDRRGPANSVGKNSGRRPGNDLFRGFDDDESHGYCR